MLVPDGRGVPGAADAALVLVGRDDGHVTDGREFLAE
ncbi:hypothetical protein J2753_001168 [Halolamina salifodinae]|uniref:Uncharacterized protein n=1 Tax=Halolamina salifodinae TaxID=1202767 RepID=A0A8T4GYN8_9EURY|nr:hypothetical protein [Halolamina salifodinae]